MQKHDNLFEDGLFNTIRGSKSSSQSDCDWLLEEAQRAFESGDFLICDELISFYNILLRSFLFIILSFFVIFFWGSINLKINRRNTENFIFIGF